MEICPDLTPYSMEKRMKSRDLATQPAADGSSALSRAVDQDGHLPILVIAAGERGQSLSLWRGPSIPPDVSADAMA